MLELLTFLSSSGTTNGVDELDDSYTNNPFVDWYKTTEDILNIFQKESVYGLDDYQFWDCLFTPISCVKAKSLWMDRSEMTRYSLLVLIKKWHKLCFENSSCKCLSFKNSTNSSWAWQVYVLLKFQLCIVCEIPKFFVWSFQLTLRLLTKLLD